MPMTPERLKTLQGRLAAANAYQNGVKGMVRVAGHTRQLLRQDLELSYDDENIRRLEAIEATLQILRRDAVVRCHDLAEEIEQGTSM